MTEFLANYALKNMDPKQLVGALEDKFGDYTTQRLKHLACKHRRGFYKTVIKLMAPVLLTWMLVQGIAAASGNHTSRWVGILAVGLAGLVFAIAWFVVMDPHWRALSAFC
jgi:hypothetical protein